MARKAAAAAPEAAAPDPVTPLRAPPGQPTTVPAPAGVRPKLDMADILSHHTPDEGQLRAIEELRQAAIDYAAALQTLTPQCADQTAALRHLAECQMTAIRSIILRGLW